MKEVTISLAALYNKFGEDLEYGEIEKSIDGEQAYFDFYSDGALVCMDGETCKVINEGENSVLLESLEGEDEAFLLSVEEFSIACFS